MTFSEYVVFVDESGDHGLCNIDPGYPVFVLACCIFRKQDYSQIVTPRLQDLKFRTFGHDAVVLHERDIRKDLGPFIVLREPQRKAGFLEALTAEIEAAPMTVIAAVIDKRKLLNKYGDGENPYEISLKFCLERIAFFLKSRGQSGEDRPTTHIMCEARGRTEDRQLELAFRRICDGDNYQRATLPFEFVLVDKRTNSLGLQLADLIARPIGMHVLRPDQTNRAWDVIQAKLYHNGSGRYQGYGLKCFP